MYTLGFKIMVILGSISAHEWLCKIDIVYFSVVKKVVLPDHDRRGSSADNHDEAAIEEVRLPFVQFSVAEIDELRSDGNGVYLDYDEVM